MGVVSKFVFFRKGSLGMSGVGYFERIDTEFIRSLSRQLPPGAKEISLDQGESFTLTGVSQPGVCVVLEGIITFVAGDMHALEPGFMTPNARFFPAHEQEWANAHFGSARVVMLLGEASMPLRRYRLY